MNEADADTVYHAISYERVGLNTPITVEVQGGASPECKEALDLAVDYLESSLKDRFDVVCGGLTVRIGHNLVDGGGEAKAEENLILLDRQKMAMTLHEVEDLLVAMGEFNPGERTKPLDDIKDNPYSCLVYELVHETGHIADWKLPGSKYNRISPKLSPTKYGKKNSWEAFAELFTYWTFGQPLPVKSVQVMEFALETPQAEYHN